MRFWIDIEDSSGNRLGEGPVYDAQYFEATTRISKAGTVKTYMPGSNPRGALIVKKRIMRAKTMVQEEESELGAGAIDHIVRLQNPDRGVLLEVSGDDLLRELVNRHVGDLTIEDLGNPDDDGPTVVMALAPSGWSLNITEGYANSYKAVYHEYDGETVLEALINLSKLTGEQFRLGSGRTVIWMRKLGSAKLTHSGITGTLTLGETVTGATSGASGTLREATGGAGAGYLYVEDMTGSFLASETVSGASGSVTVGTAYNPSSGIMALQGISPLNLESETSKCIITSLREIEDSYEALIGRVYAIGSGTGDAKLTLQGATATPPSGYALGSDAKGYYLEHTATWSGYGIERRRLFKDAQDADELYEYVFEYLTRAKDSHKAYAVEVVKLDAAIPVGKTIHVVYQRWIEDLESGERYRALDIDTDLYVLEAVNQIEASGFRSASLVVATVDELPSPEGDASALRNVAQQHQQISTHRQPSEVDAHDHDEYQLIAEKGQPSGYPGLGTNALVPTNQLGTGIADATTILRGDQTWSTVVIPDIHTHIGEILSAQCNGSKTNFSTAQVFKSDSTLVFLNGLLQELDLDYTEDVDFEGITFITAPLTGDSLVVTYRVEVEEIVVDLSGPYDPSYGTRNILILMENHDHTTASDGAYTPAEVVALYDGALFNALLISDHDLVTSQPAGIDVPIQGSELSASTGHMVSINTDYLRGGVTDRQTIINGVVADGGEVELAHPLWAVGYTYEQMAILSDWLGMEIHNAYCVGGVAGYNPRSFPGFAVGRWDALLSVVRQDIWAFSVDDFHGITYKAGYNIGRIIVFVSSSSLANIMDSLVKGCFVADVSNFGLTPGYPVITANDISLTCTGATKLRFIGKTGLLQETIGNSATYTPTGLEAYVRIEAVGSYTEAFGAALDMANRWGTQGGSWSVSSGVLHQATDTGGPHRLILKRHILGDIEITCEMKGVSASGGDKRFGIMYNFLDVDNTYYVEIQTAGTDRGLNFWKIIGGTATLLEHYAFDALDNTWSTVKLLYSMSDGRTRAKVYETGSAEPEIWHLDMVDIDLQVGGALGLRSGYAADFDNLYINGFKTYYQPIKVQVSGGGGGGTTPFEDTCQPTTQTAGSYSYAEQRLVPNMDLTITQVKIRIASPGTYTMVVKDNDENVLDTVGLSGNDEWVTVTLNNSIPMTQGATYKIRFTISTGTAVWKRTSDLYYGTHWHAVNCLFGPNPYNYTLGLGLIGTA